MKLQRFILCVILFTGSVFSSQEAFSQSDFGQFYLKNRDQTIQYSQRQIEQVRKLHFILIPGIFGHFANLKHSLPKWSQHKQVLELFDQWNPTYFEEMVSVIRDELGSDVTILYRDPKENFRKNSDSFSDRFRQIYEKRSPKSVVKKLVVIGHSKGGIDAVLTGLWHPKLFENVIEYVVAVQSPFQGGHGRPENIEEDFLARICNRYVERVDEMSPARMIALFNEALRSLTVLSPDQRNTISSRIGFVGSYIRSEEDRSWLTRLLFHSIGMKFSGEKNDGLIRSRDQVLAFGQENTSDANLIPAIGKLWGFVEADHCDPFIGKGLLLLKKSYLTPKAYFRDLPMDKEAAVKMRLQFARVFILYLLGEMVK